MRSFLIVTFSVVALISVVLGMQKAMDSSLFYVQVVEVVDKIEVSTPQDAPVDAQAVIQSAAVPVGKVSLFKLDLKGIESRVLRNEWIKEVRLQKIFPQTLSIGLTYRTPIAILQKANGGLSYIDQDGRTFGTMSLSLRTDLPILAGFDAAHPTRISAVVHLIHQFEKAPLATAVKISSITWDAEKGFRALISYPLRGDAPAVGSEFGLRIRAMVDIGSDMADPALPLQMGRLAQVVKYLGEKNIVARQIWADSGKKIVVKTAHGS